VSDVSTELISRVEHLHPVFRADEIGRWPKGVHQQLVEVGLLREGPRAKCIRYEGCGEGCFVEPELIEAPGGTSHVAFWCWKDECGGMIILEPDCLKTWEVCLDRFAQAVAASAKFVGSIMELVPGRIWLLGACPTGGGILDVFLIRGATWDDAPTVLQDCERLMKSTASVFVVPRQAEIKLAIACLQPTLLSLVELATWDLAAARLDLSGLVHALASLRPPISETGWLTVSQAAGLLANDLPFLEPKRAMARVSKAADAGKFVTNEKQRAARRIERVSFDAWRLQQRDRNLDAEERKALQR
jgi:hypothetical protein